MNESWSSWITELRNRLGNPMARRLPVDDARRAAVLVPLYVESGNLWVVLTKRSQNLPYHKGQIAFPGGSLETGEGEWEAALRETHEEIGIEPKRVLQLGLLDEASTPSGFRIVPCVGAVPFPVETRLNEGEIEEVFPLPLSSLVTPGVAEEKVVVVDGAERAIRVYTVGGRQIWGLTARILQNLLTRLGLEPETDVN